MDPYRRAEACEAVPMWLRRADGSFIPLDQGVERVAGRHATCDIVVDHPSVSPRHAGLTAGVAHVMVRDLGSDNGTWINGVPVQSATMVRLGDTIRLAGAETCVVAQGHDLEGTRVASRAVRKKRVFIRAATRGSFADVPLPELLEFYAESRKSGVLAIVAGNDNASIVIRQGAVYSASVGGVFLHDRAAVNAAIVTIGKWNDARFDFVRPQIPQPQG